MENLTLVKSKTMLRSHIKKTLSFTSSKELDTAGGRQLGSKYTALTRSDFDMSVIERWQEIRCKNAPRRRCLHSSFIHKTHFYIFGGIDIGEGKMMDLQRINIENLDNPLWEEVQYSGAMPESLSGQSGVLAGSKFYLFGGENNKQDSTNNLYILDMESFKWEKRIFAEEEVPKIYAQTSNYHPKTNTIVNFGGFIKGEYKNCLFFYSIETNEWTRLEYTQDEQKVPCGRINHSSVLAHDALFVYAGQDSDGSNLSDLWKFDLNTKLWEKIAPKNSEHDTPPARSGHSCVFHEPSNSIYIFAGKISSIQERNDFWKYDIEKNNFFLIHDTLLEQHINETDNMNQTNLSQSPKKYRFNNSKTTNFDLENQQKIENKMNSTTSSPYRSPRKIALPKSKYPSIKKKVPKVQDDSQKKLKEHFEMMVLDSRVSKKFADTMIYKMDLADSNLLRQRVNSLLTRNFFNSEKFKPGFVPAPRDGHSAVVKDNYMVVFGGDRNKYPYNDLFIFNI